MITVGMAIATLGFVLCISLGSSMLMSWLCSIIIQIITAISLGPNFQAPLIAMQTKVSPSDIAVGTATFGFVRNLSSSISIVIDGVIIQNRMLSYALRFARAGIPQETIDLIVESSAKPMDKGLTEEQRGLIRDAVSESLSKMWIFYTVLLFLGLLAGLAIGRMELSKHHEEHKIGLAAEEANRVANEKK
jgi:hypothetical protein